VGLNIGDPRGDPHFDREKEMMRTLSAIAAMALSTLLSGPAYGQ